MSLLTRSTELKRFKQGTLPKIALVVLLVIPLIYGALYLWAFWAPTDNLNKLPVAIVNLDESAEKPDGSELAAGHDVVEQLQDRKDLDWKALDADEAATAVSDGDVYFSVTIPKDFSSTLAGLQDDPKAGEIQVVYNDNNSFLASTLGKQAMVQLRGAGAETATQTAAEQVLVGVEKLSDGTRTAADAAGTLEQGTSALSAGSGKLSVGLGKLADGTAEIAAGAPALVDGTQQLATGAGAARDGSAKLAAGSQALAEGTGKVSDGATQLSAGAKTLSDKLPAAAAGATQLRAGMDELAGKAPALAKGTNDALAGSKQLAEGLPQLQAGAETVSGSLARIAALAQERPDLTLGELDQMLVSQGGSLNALVGGSEDLATKLEGASTGAQRLTAGLTELNTGASALPAKAAQAQTGAKQLETGLQQLQAGAGTLAQKSGELAAGAQQVAAKSPELASGAGQLAAGTQQLADGAGELASKTPELAAGATKLNDGAQEASSKSKDLAKGATKVDDGAGTFASKLKDGAAEAPTFAEGQTTKISETMAAPVELDETTENGVQGFGGGFAPFFIALASFVGALITWLILRPMPRRPLASNVSGLRSVLTGFGPAALIGVGQVIIMMSVLVFGIGLRPVHWVGMSLFMLLTTFAFLALQQMFIAVLGTATGRVVSLVLLMLMLSSSGGTYPVETTPGFFQVLHPFMPASYVVDGLRQLIGGGIDGRFWGSLLVMLAVLIGSLAISAVAARRQKVWTIKRLHPELAI
ncbi:YhgE/Pip domain-containing protein [Leucobacter sp. OLTLW20]|uniref:YhgE/Pip domain-containing protein n=1 Tax=Leucobacter sp. OLTLW20 TaxID=1914916 RepID=UPI000C1790F2|nr:YhgE/Pip domain-containing protein [Leucobacter sp. OLTLW20]PII88558.1 hypothetical protein BMH26_05770 [Leucobacter sp. OLTLW20]